MAGRERSEFWLAHWERWPRYIAGVLTETVYIIGLTLVAFLIAVIAMALST